MKKTLLALFALATLPAVSLAQTMTIGSASGQQGTAAAPLPVAITFTNVAGAGAVVDIDSRLTYDSTKLTIVPASAAPGACSVQAPGTIFVTVPGTGPAIANGVICNLTAINIAAAAAVGTTPLTLVNGAGSGCSNAAAIKVPCGYSPGTVTITGGPTPNTPPTLGALAASTLSGGVSPAGTGTVAVPVATAGTATASVATACSIPAGANAFTVTSGAALPFAAPAAVPGTAVVGLSCNRTAALATATLTCTQTATPAGAALPNLTSTVTCPALAVATTAITYALPPGTAAAPAGITFPTGTGGAIGTTITAGFTVTGSGFVAPQTGTVGACTFAADPTPTAPAVSDPTAFTGFAQLTFNAANNAVAQPFNGTCTRRATAVSTIMSCPETQPSNAVNPTARVYRVTCPAGNVTVVTATTPTPNPAPAAPIVLTAQAFGGGTSTQVLTFGSTGAGTMNCAVTPVSPGYSVAPLSVSLTAAGPNTATVTFTGTTSGTFLGTVVCTPVGPATGGPFTFNFSTTVAGAPVVQVQVPALGNISLMLLIAGFLGLGAVLVGRRQA